MALPPLCAVSDLEVRLGVAVGSLAGAELARANANIADASVLVRRAAEDDLALPDLVTLDAPADAVLVAIQAALRAYRNPEGLQGESVPDYSYQAAPGTVGVYLTGDEVGLVKAAMRAAAGGTLGTGTIRTPSAYTDPAADNLAFWGLL